MNPPRKHHYIPVFYLKRWVGEDGRLFQHSKAPTGEVKTLRRFPSQTAFVRNLYETSYPGEIASQDFESKYMSKLDSSAADALSVFHTTEGVPALTEKQRTAWTQFIISLIHRMPEDIEYMKRNFSEHLLSDDEEIELEYQKIRSPDDPPTSREYMGTHAPKLVAAHWTQLAGLLMSSELIGNAIYRMRWYIRIISDNSLSLLSSDRPFDMSRTVGDNNSYIAIPIGPRRVFIAAKDSNTGKYLFDLRDKVIVKSLNKTIVEQCIKFSYSSDVDQSQFIKKHLSLSPRVSFHEFYGKKQFSRKF